MRLEIPQETSNDRRPPAYREFIRQFDAGNHWRAHEVLAELWRATAEPERRRFYQGLIQLAAAFIHAERGNMQGVQRPLTKAAENLSSVRSPYLGLDVTSLLPAIEAAGREARTVADDSRLSLSSVKKIQNILYWPTIGQNGSQKPYCGTKMSG